MTTTPVSPTTQNPQWHVTLTDGTDTVGFILTDGNGKPNERAIQRTPLERSALKTSQGASKYSDFQLPYMPLDQDDWSGGRGALSLDDDASRFGDSYRADTSGGDIILGALETYGTGYRAALNQSLPGSVAWQDVYGTTRYRADSFVAATPTYAADKCEVWIRYVGSPGTLTLELCADHATPGTPGTVLKTQTVTAATVGDTLATLYSFDWTTTQSVTAGATYWIKVYGASTDSATNYWTVAGTASGGLVGSDNTAWAAGSSLYYRVTGADTAGSWRFFEYKRALYAYTLPENAASVLWLNGDRGTADANTGALTTLVDASKTWTADEWAGCTVVVIAGPGSEEDKPYRLISSNTATALTVPAWNIEHTTATDYVILGSNKWTQRFTLVQNVTDVAVAGDCVYFARGDAVTGSGYKVARISEYNNAGAWDITTRALTEETNLYACHLLPIMNSDGTVTMWGSRNAHPFFGKTVWKAKVPPRWGGLYLDMGEVAPTDVPWDGRPITNVTQDASNGNTLITVAAGFTTGVAAVHNLAKTVDIRQGDQLGVFVKSNFAHTASDLQLLYDDVEDLGLTISPKVRHYKGPDAVPPLFLKKQDEITGAATFDDLESARDADTGTNEAITWETDDYIFVGHEKPFNTITFNWNDFNAVASVMTADYYNGSAFTSVTITDGTISPAGTTCGQDGAVTFAAPTDWELLSVNANTAYWVRLKVSVTLTATRALAEVTVTPVDGTIADLPHTVDGDTATSDPLPFDTDHYLYAGYTRPFNKATVNIGSTVNAVASVMTAQYRSLDDWASVTITDGTITSGATLAKDGTITWTIPYDWAQTEVDSETAYWIRFKVDANITAGVVLNEITVTRQSNTTLNLPALVANQWTWVPLNISPLATQPDCSSIASIGLNVAVDRGAETIELQGGIRLIRDSKEYLQLPQDSRITNLVAYSGDPSVPVETPWVFTESMIYPLTEDTVSAIPLGELAQLRSPYTGKAAVVNDVYLYFSYGEEKIERYHQRVLDDVGPDLDEGLPSGRRGTISALVSYPGRIIAAIDAGTGTSSVLMRRGSGWHELYRAPRANLRIWGLYHQAVEGDAGRLWIAQGCDILWIPVALNPYTSSSYTYTCNGAVETPWIYGGMQDVVKQFKSVKLFIENTTATYYIQVDYKKDADTTWTPIAGNFDSAPREEINLSAASPPAVTGRRLKLRYRLFSLGYKSTPRLIASVLEAYGVVDPRYAYSFQTVLVEDELYIDLNEQKQGALGYTSRVETAQSKLDTWAAAGTALTQNSAYSIYNGKTVIVQPTTSSPIKLDRLGQSEQHILQVVTHDL